MAKKKKKVTIAFPLPMDCLDFYSKVAKFADTTPTTAMTVVLAIEVLKARTAKTCDESSKVK